MTFSGIPGTGQHLFIRSELILPDENPAQVWDGPALPGEADRAFVLTGMISKYGSKKAMGR